MFGSLTSKHTRTFDSCTLSTATRLRFMRSVSLLNTYVVKRYKFMKQTTTILYYNNITALFKNYLKLSRTVIMYLRLMQFGTETKH